MKSLYTCALLVMLSAIILAYTTINKEKTNYHCPPAEIEDLRFNVTGTGEKFRVITADFDLVSGEESNGEIRIIVDGRQLVNNRLILKKGDAHYSVEFLMNSKAGENQRLCSATANLIIKGETKDVKQKDFVLNNPSLAQGRTNAGQ